MLTVAMVLASSPTFAALPQTMAQNITAAAAAAQALQTRPNIANQSQTGNSLQWINNRRDRDSGNNVLSSVVVSAISARPDLVSEIIATAVQAAPASATSLARQAAHVFPGFAPKIAQSAGLSLAVVQTSAYADYTASPSYNAQPDQQRQASAPTLYRPVYPVTQSTQPVPKFQLATEPATPDNHTIAEDQKIAPGFHGQEEISDPAEGLNRAVFAFNDALDIMVLRPISALYGYLMPPPAKPAAQRFFKNLSAPVVMINDLVQLDGQDAAVTAGRFAINSTVGILGLFEMAEKYGLKEHHADFGQSLHSYGVGPGPYVVLPLMGPSNLRDASGNIVDGFLDPIDYALNANARLGRAGASIMVGREGLLTTLDDLRENSVDYYAALRAALYQNRVLELNKGRAGLAAAATQQTDDLFDDAE